MDIFFAICLVLFAAFGASAGVVVAAAIWRWKSKKNTFAEIRQEVERYRTRQLQPLSTRNQVCVIRHEGSQTFIRIVGK